MPAQSHAEWLAAAISPAEREAWLRSLSPQELEAFWYNWRIWARPAQLPPEGDWQGWIVKTGRGWGKTRVGAEWVRMNVEQKRARRVALLNDTSADTRDVMVEGPAGILSVCPPSNRPIYEPSKRRLTWPNGAVAIMYSAEAPELLRGPEHDLAWADEPAKWRNLRKADAEGGTAWDNLMFGLRIGQNPRWLATTTPRTTRFMRALLKQEDVVITEGTSAENFSSLAPAYRDRITKRYQGTRLGRQELEGKLLDDVVGALWNSRMFDLEGFRNYNPPHFTRLVVAVDPAATSVEGQALRQRINGDGTDPDAPADTGIVVAGRDAAGRGYVLADRTLGGTPAVWATAAVKAYYEAAADCIVAEMNNGSEMVEAPLRTIDPTVPVKLLSASRGKRTRAVPVSALYERRMVDHVGVFPDLEDEMTTWVPDTGMPSPNRMDAAVWSLTELLLEEPKKELKLWG